jgi:hypothetical protein
MKFESKPQAQQQLFQERYGTFSLNAEGRLLVNSLQMEAYQKLEKIGEVCAPM